MYGSVCPKSLPQSFMPIPLKLSDDPLEQVAKHFVEGFRQAIYLSIVHRRLLLGKLELLA